jgi:hypothetical protein
MIIFLIFTALHFPVILAGEFTGSIVTLKERLTVNVELAKMCKGAGPIPTTRWQLLSAVGGRLWSPSCVCLCTSALMCDSAVIRR